jgi:hypothetical protein
VTQIFELKNTAVDDLRDDGGPVAGRRWYYGCGRGRLALLGDEPIGLIYDNDPSMTIADLPPHDRLIAGMISSWQFVAS